MTTVEYNKDKRRCSRFYDSLSRDREEGGMCDVKITVGNSTFSAHKCLLAINSKYFQAMFSGGFIENEKGLVDLKDAKEESFRILLDFMYGECLELEKYSLKIIFEAIDLAEFLLLDIFILECKEYVSDWRSNGMLNICYALAKKLKLNEMEEEIRMEVYQKLVPNGSKLKIKFENVSTELMFEAWEIFDDPEKHQKSSKDINSMNFIETKIKQLFNYLVLHPEICYEDLKRFFSLAGLEMLPFSLFNKIVLQCLPDVAGVYYENIGLATREIHSQIEENISKEPVKISMMEIKGFSFRLAEYDMTVHDWVEVFYLAGFKIKHSFTDEDKLYLVGSDCYGIYDQKTKVMSEIKLLQFDEERFQCECIFVSEGKMYFLGQHLDSLHVSIAILDMARDDFSRRELNQSFLGNVALTLRDGIVYYLNGNRCYRYDTRLCTLSALSSFPYNFKVEYDTKLVAFEDHLFVFQSKGYYRMPLEGNFTPEDMRRISDTNNRFQTLSVSSVSDGIVVSCLNGPTNEIQLFKYSPDMSEFLSLGFLAEHKMIGESNTSYMMSNLQNLSND